LSNIQEAYHKIIKEIQVLKQKGFDFDWNNFDLSSILISEFIADDISSEKIKNNNFLKLLKLKIYTLKQRLKFHNKKNSSNNSVLIFYNSSNQWENIEPVIQEFKKIKVSVHVTSTKINLLENLPKDIESYELLLGYSIPKKNFNPKKIKSNIINLAKNSLPKLEYLYKSFNNIFKQSNYKYVLIGNDNTSEGKLLALIAQKLNIHVGTIQHGSINRINPVYGLNISNDFFVFGEKPKKELLFLGKKENEIIISGWPATEIFKNKINTIKNKQSFIEKADVLVCLSGPGHSVSFQHHINTISLISKLQVELNLKIIIKLHPKDKLIYYKNFNTSQTSIFTNESLEEIGSSLTELFTKVKVTITGASNSALESLLTEKPVITIDLINAYSVVDFIKDGLTLHSKSYAELRKNYEIIENNNYEFSNEIKNKIEKYYYNFFNSNNSPSKLIAIKIQEKCVV
jgi:UDP-N-acetylglucosamine 2-epimerase